MGQQTASRHGPHPDTSQDVRKPPRGHALPHPLQVEIQSPPMVARSRRLLCLLGLVTAACGGSEETAPSTAPPPFMDVTQDVGIDFVHQLASDDFCDMV